MNVDINAVASSMLDAVRTAVADRWPAVRVLAESELRKLASTFADVEKLLASGKIDRAHARTLIRMQENSARTVLRTVEGVSVLTSRKALNAAMGAAAALINPILGFNVIALIRKPEIPTSSNSSNKSTPQKKQKTVAATRATSRAASTTAASTEPTEEATSNFKAGKDL